MRGRAAVFTDSSRGFSLVEFDLPELKPGEVLVEVSCCTICGSDLHTWSGRRSGPPACILGHEIVGVVRDFHGDGPTDYFGNPIGKGMRITWNLTVGCGSCFFCRRELPQKCESLFKYGHQGFDGTKPTGGLSTHCILVPGTLMFLLPDGLPDVVACPANCATATVAATIRTMSELPLATDAEIWISGMGMLGLTAVAMLGDGSRNIIGVDMRRDRLELARQLGATHLFEFDEVQNLQDDHLGEVGLRKQGCDVALEFSGADAAVQSSIESLRIGGTAVLVGSVFPGQPIDITAETIVRKALTLRGVHNYRPDDLETAIRFLACRGTKQHPLKPLVSATFGLDEVDAAFAAAHSGEHVRVAVIP